MKQPDIIFDAERMKNPHTGMFHYCKNLGAALLNQQSLHTPKLGFYLPPSVSDVFGKDAYTITQRPFHKVFMRSLNAFEVWHCTNQQTSYFPYKSKKKIALTIHDLNFLYEKGAVKKRQRYLDVLQKKVRRADAIITISNFVKGEIEQHLELRNKQVEVIYNGCNISDQVKPVKPAQMTDSQFVFSLGTITPKKNFHVLPATILRNDLHLVLAGVVHSEAYLHKIFAEAKRLGVENRVHFIGSITEEEKHWLLANCSLFCFPSLAEGFGLPVIEAMRFGKPTLLSQATSLPEVGGSVAFYLENFEPEHIAAMANKAVQESNTDLARKVVEWSLQFSWENAAKAYWQVYERLCSK